MSSNVYNIFNFFISLFHKFIYQWGSIKYQRTGPRYHKTYFYEMKNEKSYEQPEHENFFLFSDKFVIFEAVLNVQPLLEKS